MILNRLGPGVAGLAVALLFTACGSDADVATSAATTLPATTATGATSSTTTSAAPETTTTTVAPTTTAPPGPSLTLAFDGLPALAGGAHYEGWLIVDDSPVSIGSFTIGADKSLLDLDGTVIERFEVDDAFLGATSVVITIEPADDEDPAPSATHILAGDLAEGSATLVVGHPAALGTDFADATGIYVLATPTDGDRVNNEDSGVWFLVFPGPTPGLDLPELPEGWTYEGWTIIDDIPVTTGTFQSVSGSDDSAPYSGTVRTPAFPGEDFLVNAPAGLTFPVDLRGSTVAVSVEPVPDTDPEPFSLVPLSGPIPANAELEPVSYPITSERFEPPTGSATISS